MDLGSAVEAWDNDLSAREAKTKLRLEFLGKNLGGG